MIVHRIALLTVMAAWVTAAAGAGTGAIGGMPWLSPLQIFFAALSGPTAYYIGGIMYLVCCARMLMHHDWGQFGMSMLISTILTAIMLFAGPMLTTLFGATGAVI